VWALAQLAERKLFDALAAQMMATETDDGVRAEWEIGAGLS
jgi:hypothetical protein